VIERIQGELKGSLRAGDRSRTSALRLLLSALQKAAKDQRTGAFSEDDALVVLRRERKQRVEAAEAFRGAGHEQRAAAEEADLPVIDEFLPAPLGESELAALVDAAIADTGAAGMRDMGRVMALVRERSGGRADGRAASELVRARLAG
jgi:uncharacterized protein YqeY